MCVPSQLLLQILKNSLEILSARIVKNPSVEKDLLKLRKYVLFPTVQNNHLMASIYKMFGLKFLKATTSIISTNNI